MRVNLNVSCGFNATNKSFGHNKAQVNYSPFSWDTKDVFTKNDVFQVTSLASNSFRPITFKGLYKQIEEGKVKDLNTINPNKETTEDLINSLELLFGWASYHDGKKILPPFPRNSYVDLCNLCIGIADTIMKRDLSNISYDDLCKYEDKLLKTLADSRKKAYPDKEDEFKLPSTIVILTFKEIQNVHIKVGNERMRKETEIYTHRD